MVGFIYRTMTERPARRDGRLVMIESEVDTLAIRRGQRIFVRGIVGQTVYDLAEVEETDDGNLMATFLDDSIITVEGLHENRMTCNHLRFARPSRPRSERPQPANGRRQQVFHNRPCRWAGSRLLLAALMKRGERPLHIFGGLRFARAYCPRFEGDGAGEIIVPAPGKKHVGTPWDIPYFYIVRRDEVDSLLATLNETHTHSYRTR